MWSLHSLISRPPTGAALTGLLPLLAKKRPRELFFYVRAEAQPDGSTRVFAPLGMLKAARQSCDVSVHRVLAEQKEELRDLHAKMVVLANDDWQMLLAGSSNFTGAGLTAPRGNGSCEANVVYRVKVSDSDFKLFESIWPDIGDEFDLEDPDLVWDPVPEECEEGAEEVPCRPVSKMRSSRLGRSRRFLSALSQVSRESWSIRDAGGRRLARVGLGSQSGGHTIPWGSRTVPFVLQVSWESGSGTAAASWPVNVSNPSELPPPDSLRDLSLEELLEILASTRPLHDAVSQSSWRGESKASASMWSLDPPTSVRLTGVPVAPHEARGGGARADARAPAAPCAKPRRV